MLFAICESPWSHLRNLLPWIRMMYHSMVGTTQSLPGILPILYYVASCVPVWVTYEWCVQGGVGLSDVVHVEDSGVQL
jgi:hypothetical protein